MRDDRRAVLVARVVDENGAPIEGAIVTIGPNDATTTSATDGSFELPRLPSPTYRVWAVANGFARGTLDVSSDDRTPAVMQLTRGRTLRLHVVDGAGSPVAGAVVDIDPANTTITGADGVAVVGGIGQGFSLATVRAPGFTIGRVGHVLRHTFASHLAMRGATLKVIQDLLGHSTILMTMRYAHLAPEVARDAVRLLDSDRRGRELAEKTQKTAN